MSLIEVKGRQGAIAYGKELKNESRQKYYTELRKCFKKYIIPKSEKKTLTNLLEKIESCLDCAKS